MDTILDTGTHKVEVIETAPATPNPTYKTGSEQITVNGGTAQSLSPVYFGIAGDSINITLNIVNDNGDVQTSIDQTALCYPPMLALPIVKVAGGATVIDEVYATTTIINGVMNATLNTGVLTSGNWVLSEERINASLAEIGALWTISMNSISFRMGS